MQVFDVVVAASPARAWQALIDPDETQRWYFGCRFESALAPGARYVYASPAGPAEEGVVVAVEPPLRLVLSAHYLFDPRTAEEAPHPVTWELAPEGDRTRVTVRIEAPPGSASATVAAQGMPAVLAGLARHLEPIARLEAIGAIDVLPLTPGRVDDWLGFFDRDAFADNPAWAACYCTAFHRTTEEVHPAQENRALARDLVSRGVMQGFLAYVDGKVAGWLNAAPRTTLVGFARTPHLAVPDPERVGAVSCFVVAAAYRRHGIAKQLLGRAVQSFKERGLAFAEGYPAKDPRTDAGTFRGPLKLYEDLGFVVHKDAGRSWIVRKGL